MIPRVYAYAAVGTAALLLLTGTYLKGRSDGAENERETQQSAIVKAQAQARAQEAVDRAERDARETSYLQRIRELESDHIRPVLSQPVRLCVPAGERRSGTPDAATSLNAARPDVQHDVPPSPDIGPALREYGRLCESLRIQLDELQQWVTATR